MKTPHLSALASLLLASCATTSQVSLDYVASPGQIRPGRADFTMRDFGDRRGTGPLELGTVRTQIGTPVEHVRTRIPANQIVTNAFAHGLDARGMLAPPQKARYAVTGEVLDLYCQMLVRPYGFARVRVMVLDADSGQVLSSGVFKGERQGPAYIPGSGSPVPMLRDLTSGALQDAVDRALDDPQMRNRLEGRSPMPPAAPGGYEPGML